jgi:hypothetical protein
VFDTTANLFIELGGPTPGSQYDQVHVTGQLSLGGALKIDLIDLGGGLFTPAAGNSFDILDWGSLVGTFSSLQLPALDGTLAWNTSQLYTSGVLSVVFAGLPGDYNHNGIVDAADYTLWRDGLGTTYTQADYNIWKANFGAHAGSGSGATATVPEPATLWMLLAGILTLCYRRRATAL